MKHYAGLDLSMETTAVASSMRQDIRFTKRRLGASLKRLPKCSSERALLSVL